MANSSDPAANAAPRAAVAAAPLVATGARAPSWRSALERHLLAAVGVLVALALVCAAFVDPLSARRAALRERTSTALDDLAFLAGLTDAGGAPLVDERLRVTAVSDAGPEDALAAAADALARDPAFVEGDSPHLLRVEVVREGAADVIALRLWRNGWDLRTPEPSWNFFAPGWAFAILGVGAIAVALSGRVAAGLLAAGGAAQVLLARASWPAEVPNPPTAWQALTHGPLVSAASRAVRGLPGGFDALAIAFLCFCLVLVYFDHRRHPDRAALPAIFVAAVAGALGLLALLEGVWRLGAFAAALTPGGGGAWLMLSAAWAVAVVVAVERHWRPPGERTTPRDGGTLGGEAPVPAQTRAAHAQADEAP